MGAASVLVLNDHEIVRFGLCMLVSGCSQLRVAAAAGSLEEGLRHIREQAPALVITELRLRDAHGMEALRALVAAQQPRATLVVSAHDELLYGQPALALGARGYAMTDTAPADLLEAALAAVAGDGWTSPALREHLLGAALRGARSARGVPPSAPTARELQVLDELRAGKSTKQIAAALAISPRTVDFYRACIKKKLGLRTRAELIAVASRSL